MSYLMDDIAKAAIQIVGPNRSHPILSVFPELNEDIAASPRFLLTEQTIMAATEIAMSRPKVILDSLEHCRVPFDSMWVEWPDKQRCKHLSEALGSYLETPDRPVPPRLGFYLTADKGGRSGRLTWVWSSPEHVRSIEMDGFANVGCIYVQFNFDERIPQPEFIQASMVTNQLFEYWKDNPVQQQALYRIWETSRHVPSKWGERYLDWVEKRGDTDMTAFLGNCYADVYGEYITFITVILLLTASRRAVEYKPVDRSKINKVRTAKKEAPLFDHNEVVMHVVRPKEGVHRGPLSFTRKSPRIHLVSRYLARRGDKHWIVEPYFRGDGAYKPRTVHVKP